MNADPVVKGVLLLLLAASVWSWAVILDKLWRIGAVSRSARAHEARAAAAKSGGEMGIALNGELGRLETHLPFLATLGSAAPFIGLFGTVWGIMRSFAGIAAAQNTSLAVVAPGIAEALFATAMGLAAAIPAGVAYNKITVELGRFAGRMQGLIGRSGGLLARAVGV